MPRKRPAPPPLLVEDVPSSDASDLEDVTVRIRRRAPPAPNPALLNGSSSNWAGSSSSNINMGAGVRSAPNTPIGMLQPTPAVTPTSGSGGGAGSSGSTAGDSGLSPPCSPANCPNHAHPNDPSAQHHHSRSTSLSKYEKGTIKQLSCSAPSMTVQTRSPEPPSPKSVKDQFPAGSSKARQKKFHRHFTQVADEERVLNYYSCALVGDILLQGHLYITRNYFAFYSNVFGYVTKLLIPTVSVLKISKEKTARIIPNAVGIATEDDKHVFGSLLSRDSTYKLMTSVWKAAITEPIAEAVLPPTPEQPPESEYSVDDSSCSQSGNESPGLSSNRRLPSSSAVLSQSDCPSSPEIEDVLSFPPKLNPDFLKMSGVSLQQQKQSSKVTVQQPVPTTSSSSALAGVASIAAGMAEKLRGGYAVMAQLPRHSLLLLASTLLLLLLFLSAGLLLYRIGRMQHKYAMGVMHDNIVMLSKGDDVYNEILRWQTQLHTKSAQEVHTFLSANLDQIAKIRKSLEALSLLLSPFKEHTNAESTENKVKEGSQATLAAGNQFAHKTFDSNS